MSYIDAQIGKLLDALKKNSERNNTIIFLWFDHGFHLGGNEIWCKHTNYELSTRVPLMIVDPRNRAFAACAQSESPVERVDIFASLCDLADVAAPADIDGTSLRPMLLDASNRVKSVETSQFPRWYEGLQLIGNACRNERFCYIEWEDSNFEKEDRRGEIIDIEL